MKKFITLTITFCMIFSCFTVSSNAMTKIQKKYTKVKTTTYQKYKKAYKNQKSLKNKITKLEKQLANKQAAYEDAMDQYELALEDAETTHDKLDSANSSNKWLWTNLKSMGIQYKNKVWTVPSELPTTFMIDGVKYKVVIQQIQEGN